MWKIYCAISMFAVWWWAMWRDQQVRAQSDIGWICRALNLSTSPRDPPFSFFGNPVIFIILWHFISFHFPFISTFYFIFLFSHLKLHPCYFSYKLAYIRICWTKHYSHEGRNKKASSTLAKGSNILCGNLKFFSVLFPNPCFKPSAPLICVNICKHNLRSLISPENAITIDFLKFWIFS